MSEAAVVHPSAIRRGMPHAIVMMLLIIVATVAMTYVVPSGEFARSKDGLVTPGSYHTVAKDYSAPFAARPEKVKGIAYPAQPTAVISSIPAGMTRSAALIFMILFIGGMFGVLQATNALEAGIERLVVVTHGNVNIVVPVFMIVLALGSTFLGLISEYLVVIPIALVLAERLGFDALFGTALVTIAAKIGYLTSVTNPLALAVAQPIVGVPVFSGVWFRAITFIVFLPLGIWYLLRAAKNPERRIEGTFTRATGDGSRPMTTRQTLVLLVLLAAIGVMVYGVEELKWGNPELSAMYIGVALAIAIVAFLTRSVEGKPPVIVANLMMAMQMIIDVFIPSTSGKAAVTMPILGPIGQLAGVSGQVTVQAFLFGNGLMNTVTPTSGMLLAYLATGKVSYGKWIRFIIPLVLILVALCVLALTTAVLIGY